MLYACNGFGPDRLTADAGSRVWDRSRGDDSLAAESSFTLIGNGPTLV